MDTTNKRILVTGGAGFIGSHVAEALLRQHVKLSIVDNLNNFYSPERKRANLREVSRSGNLDFYATDICDSEALRRVFNASHPDAVIHLAAYAGVRPSIERPKIYEQVNVGGTLNLLELCRQFGVQKFIFASSSSVYGAQSSLPFREDDVQLRPVSPYAATKLAGEMLAHTYAHLYRLPVVSLRFFTVYGPRQRPDLAIHRFTILIESGMPISFYGDGTTGRDYTYVDDIVSGVLGALNYDPPQNGAPPFEVFNLGNSHPVLLRDLVSALESAIDRPAVLKHEPDQPGDVPMTWADITKAATLLNYAPRTSLPDGLRKFISWRRAGSVCRYTATSSAA